MTVPHPFANPAHLLLGVLGKGFKMGLWSWGCFCSNSRVLTKIPAQFDRPSPPTVPTKCKKPKGVKIQIFSFLLFFSRSFFVLLFLLHVCPPFLFTNFSQKSNPGMHFLGLHACVLKCFCTRAERYDYSK